MKASFQVFLGVMMGAFIVSGVACAADDASAQVSMTQQEIERLKSEKEADIQRIEDMRQEREHFVKEIRRVENLNSKYTKNIEEMRLEMSAQQKDFEDRMKKMETRIKDGAELKAKNEAPAVVASGIPAVQIEKETNDVLSKGGDLDPEDDKFKEELARAHYNMGNVYFERGEYQRAVVEYYQAVDLMPYDADAHYNLAFVSGEYIGDQETAQKHYQWYLYLKPNAEDKKLIEEKLVGTRLNLRGRLPKSRVDMPVESGHTNVAR